jgi:hypothetical protein
MLNRRVSGDDGPVETSGTGRFGDGVGVDRVGECGPDRSDGNASPDQGAEGEPGCLDRVVGSGRDGATRRVRAHSRRRHHGKRANRRRGAPVDG